MVKCEDCGTEKMTDKVIAFSKKQFNGRVLCFNCQKHANKEDKEEDVNKERVNNFKNKESDKYDLGMAIKGVLNLLPSIPTTDEEDKYKRAVKMIFKWNQDLSKELLS